MLKKIGKVCVSLVVAFFLALAVWYFLLIKLPEDVLRYNPIQNTWGHEDLDSYLRYNPLEDRFEYAK